MKFTLTPSSHEDINDIFKCICNPLVYEKVRIIPKDNKMSFVFEWIKNAHNNGNYTIRDSEGHFIGCAGLHINKQDEQAEIGYFLSPIFHGNGLATMVVKDLIEKAKEHNLKSVHATTALDNIASIKVLEKNGFEFLKEVENIDANGKTRQSFKYIKLLT
jgi:RimJ/RimL family protein N-acetyltransferase